MLHRKKLFLLSLLAAVGVGATAASTALAVEATPHFIKGAAEVKEPLKAKATVVKFFISTPADKLLVLCPGIKAKATVGGSWKSSLTIEFSECMVREPETCKIGNGRKITVSMLDQLVYKKGVKGEEFYDILYGEESKRFEGLFTTILFEGTCVYAGEQPVKGSAIALPAPKKPGEEAEVLSLKFNEVAAAKYTNRSNEKVEEAGSMMFGGNPAFLEGEVKLELEPKAKFGAE